MFLLFVLLVFFALLFLGLSGRGGLLSRLRLHCLDLGRRYHNYRLKHVFVVQAQLVNI